MEIIIQQTPDEASAYAARLMARLLRGRPGTVLGLATGSTPLRLYRELIRLHSEADLDFSHAKSFNLDEYIGLASDHAASYRFFMQENFFQHINILPENTYVPDGLARDIPAACARYEAQILEAGGIDLQVLGIGGDGHIGFNEPSSSLASRTRIKTLTERTRQDNAPYFSEGESVPEHVVTMGVGTIMEARTIVLLAFGEGKAQAVADAVEGPITSMVPASVLQMHPSVHVLVDEAAASRLRRRDYYRWVFERKPAWQKA